MSDANIAVLNLMSAVPKATAFSPRLFGQHHTAASAVGEADAFSAGFDEGYRVASEAATIEREALLALIAQAEAFQPEASDELAAMIAETVCLLVQEIVGNAALDRTLLEQRIAVAVALISECDTARSLHLHPEDAALLQRCALQLEIVADSSLARGDLRIDCSQGWVEHGSSIYLEALRKQLGVTGAIQ
jgi:flagellar assembly protein FliH